MSNTPKLLPKEVWKNIRGYKGIYQVSNLGRVKSFKNNKWGNSKIFRILKLEVSTGYNMIGLWKNGGRYTYKVSRLVGKTFLSNPKRKKEVNHKNGIKTDDRSINLEWSTRAENMKHAFKTGLHSHVGIRHPRVKLNEKQVRVIKHLKNMKTSMNQSDIAKIFNVSTSAISLIFINRNWSHIKI